MVHSSFLNGGCQHPDIRNSTFVSCFVPIKPKAITRDGSKKKQIWNKRESRGECKETRSEKPLLGLSATSHCCLTCLFFLVVCVLVIFPHLYLFLHWITLILHSFPFISWVPLFIEALLKKLIAFAMSFLPTDLTVHRLLIMLQLKNKKLFIKFHCLILFFYH